MGWNRRGNGVTQTMTAQSTRAAAAQPVAPSPAAVDDPGAALGPHWLDAFLATDLPRVVELRRDIHAHPELSLRETRTTVLVRDTLARAGIESTILPGGTGLIAEVGHAAGPTIALRADIDALPLTEMSRLPYASRVDGVTHACGHDVHTAVLVGAALALRRAPNLPGRVRLLFQPAEEVMEGSRQLVDAGAIDGVARAYALHCDPEVRVGRIGLRVGPITSATDIVTLELSGPGGHTSRPHLTVDLIGALSRVATQLPALLARRLDPRAGATLVWGAVDAGETFNVIPRRGVLSGTLRVLDRDAWEQSQTLLARLVEELLAPTGARFELRHTPGVPPVVNDPASVATLRRAVTAALGPGAVADAPQSTGAEDFAFLLDHVPGALARLGVWDGVSDQVDLHTPDFRIDERAIPAGIRALVHTALTALTDLSSPSAAAATTAI